MSEISAQKGSKLQVKSCADLLSLAAHVARQSLFSGLRQEAIVDILNCAHAEVRVYPSHSYVPDLDRWVLAVLSGEVAIYVLGLKSDDRHLLRIVGEDAVVGSAMLFVDSTNLQLELLVCRHASLLFLEREGLQRAVRQLGYQQFVLNLVAAQGMEIAGLYRKISVLSYYETSDRVQMYKRMCNQGVQDAVLCRTRAAMAEYLGVNRTALYRAIEKKEL